MDLIESLLVFYKGSFGIKWPIKIDMPLNKETKPFFRKLSAPYTDTSVDLIRELVRKTVSQPTGWLHEIFFNDIRCTSIVLCTLCL